MSSRLFDGSFRSRPAVSLRGQSKREESKEDLVLKAQQARQQRELLRKQARAADVIRRFYRSRREVRRYFAAWRLRWDAVLANVHEHGPAAVRSLACELVLFYNPTTDRQRLAKLAPLLVAPVAAPPTAPLPVFYRTRLALLTVEAVCRLPPLEAGPQLDAVLCALASSAAPGSSSAAACLLLLAPSADDAAAIVRYALHPDRGLVWIRDAAAKRATLPPSVLYLIERLTADANVGAAAAIAATLMTVPALASVLDAPTIAALHGAPFWEPLLRRVLAQFSLDLSAHALVVLANILALWTGRARTVATPLTEQDAFLCAVAALVAVVPVRALDGSRSDVVVDTADEDSDQDWEDDALLPLAAAADERRPSMGADKSAAALDPRILATLEILFAPELAAVLARGLAPGGPTVAAALLVAAVHARWPRRQFQFLEQIVRSGGPTLLYDLWKTMDTHAPTTMATTLSELPTAPKLTLIHEPQHALFWAAMVAVALLFNHLLTTVTDDEFHDPRGLLARIDKGRLVQTFCHVAALLYHRETFPPDDTQLASLPLPAGAIRQLAARVLKGLNERDCRQPFVRAEVWRADLGVTRESLTTALLRRLLPRSDHIEDADAMAEDEPALAGRSALAGTGPGRAASAVAKYEQQLAKTMRDVPFLLPFDLRAQIFRTLIRSSSEQISLHWNRSRGDWAMLHARVRRNHLFEDGFQQLQPHGSKLKQRLSITFVSDLGYDEPGIDGGGVMKEFMNGLIKEAFDPRVKLFSMTVDHRLYPNPWAFADVEGAAAKFAFLGRMLGKLLLEGIIVELPLAGFFLNALLRRPNTLDDLASLDAAMYRNLVKLKTYSGNVEDLSLYFSVTLDHDGERIEVELVPGGRDMPVTAENRAAYVRLIAHYRLNVQIQRGVRAFLGGVHDVLDLSLLRLFNQRELQTLISGTSAPIDLTDLAAHTVYHAPYSATHPNIRNFWTAAHMLDDVQRSKLLKFATSCSRPPLLGFAELQPSFAIAAVEDADRLPTASTCVNLLKLPVYPDLATLEEKLRYAIESDAGFEYS